MQKKLDLLPFPNGAQSDGFIAALSSALLPCLGIGKDVLYWCNPNGGYCSKCGQCGTLSTLSKHQEMLYHTLLTASGLAFTFDYPEDDHVDFHTMPGVGKGWRWEEPFMAELMDFAGLSYIRYKNQSIGQMRGLVKDAIHSGYPALAANHGQWGDPMEWARCWNLVCGYEGDGLCFMGPGGGTTVQRDGKYEDWILITGKAERKLTYREVLEKTYSVLTHPSHEKLERQILRDLSRITPENAADTAYKMTGINGVPIESRWHAAEAFLSRDNLLSSLPGPRELKRRIGSLLFTRYIDDNNQNGTHGVGWRIWGCLKVGPKTGYLPTEESFGLIQKPEVQQELKRLFGIVFDNDRAVAKEIAAALEEI